MADRLPALDARLDFGSKDWKAALDIPVVDALGTSSPSAGNQGTTATTSGTNFENTVDSPQRVANNDREQLASRVVILKAVAAAKEPDITANKTNGNASGGIETTGGKMVQRALRRLTLFRFERELAPKAVAMGDFAECVLRATRAQDPTVAELYCCPTQCGRKCSTAEALVVHCVVIHTKEPAFRGIQPE